MNSDARFLLKRMEVMEKRVMDKLSDLERINREKEERYAKKIEGLQAFQNKVIGMALFGSLLINVAVKLI